MNLCIDVVVVLVVGRVLLGRTEGTALSWTGFFPCGCRPLAQEATTTRSALRTFQLGPYAIGDETRPIQLSLPDFDNVIDNGMGCQMKQIAVFNEFFDK
jgi:hypothetical protein